MHRILQWLACYTDVHVDRRNCARFGAPTGSVNSFFINERKQWYSCEHSSCLLQKIISLCLEVFSIMANGVKAYAFCRTAYDMLGLFCDVEIITGLMRPSVAIVLSLVSLVTAAVMRLVWE